MMANENGLYFVADLMLFACFLLYWVHLLRPTWVTEGMLLGNLLLFLSGQGIALLWSVVRLEPWALVTTYLSLMLLVQTTVLVYLLLERLLRQRGLGAFVVTLALAMHAYVILFIPGPVEQSLYLPPVFRSWWYLLHLLGALIAYGACVCAGGASIGYFVARRLARSRLAPRLASWQDCQAFTRRALVIGFPWLTASVVMGVFWTQSAWGSYWPWRPDEVWVLIVWLILTMALHARTLRTWEGRPLALLSLLGLASALVSLPLLGPGPGSAW